MAIVGRDKYVMDPTDVRGAGFDEWSQMTGVQVQSPLLGGAGFLAGDAGALHRLGSFTDVVTGSEGTMAMPGGAPAERHDRARWNDWRELFNPHSPMPWLLLFAIFATSLVHFRLQGGVGRVRAGVGVG